MDAGAAARLRLADAQGDEEGGGGVVAELRARHGRSMQPESLQVMAVLQAVVEVVTAEGLNPADPTTLFAACMSSLERPDTRGSPQVGAGAWRRDHGRPAHAPAPVRRGRRRGGEGRAQGPFGRARAAGRGPESAGRPAAAAAAAAAQPPRRRRRARPRRPARGARPRRPLVPTAPQVLAAMLTVLSAAMARAPGGVMRAKFGGAAALLADVVQDAREQVRARRGAAAGAGAGAYQSKVRGRGGRRGRRRPAGAGSGGGGGRPGGCCCWGAVLSTRPAGAQRRPPLPTSPCRRPRSRARSAASARCSPPRTRPRGPTRRPRCSCCWASSPTAAPRCAAAPSRRPSRCSPRRRARRRCWRRRARRSRRVSRAPGWGFGVVVQAKHRWGGPLLQQGCPDLRLLAQTILTRAAPHDPPPRSALPPPRANPVCRQVLPGPAAAARAAAAASNKQRSAAEDAIARAVSDALHLLGALKQLLPLMAGPSLPGVVDQALKLYSLRQPLLTRHATDALAALAAAPGGHLAPGQLDQLLGIALDSEELWAAAAAGGGAAASGGADGPLALVRLVEAGLRALAGRDAAAAARRLPRAALALGAQLGARQDGVRHGAREALAALLSDPAVMSDALVADGARAAAAGGGGPPHPLAGTVAALVAALRPAAADSWSLAIPVAAALLRRLGEAMQAALTGQLPEPAAGGKKAGKKGGKDGEGAHSSGPAAAQAVARGIALAAAPLVRQLGELYSGAFDAEEDAAGGDPLAALAGGEGADADGDSDGGGGGRRRGAARGAAGGAAGGGGGGGASGTGAAAEAALGVAVRWLGPEAVLAALPLQLKEGIDGTAEPRTWLLPMLRRHVRGARLGYWTAALLPLARALGGRAAAAAAAGDKLLALHCHTLEAQIWAALPAFCSWPADAAEAYPAAAKDWAAAFHGREDLRAPVAAALERLCRQARAVAAAAGDASLVPPGERGGGGSGPDGGGRAAGGGGSDAGDDGRSDTGSDGPLDSDDEYGAPSRGRRGGRRGRGGGGGGDEEGDGDGGLDPELGSPPAWFDAARAAAQLGALRPLGRNWLPLLLTTFLEAEPDARAAIAGAVAAYASISDAGLVGGLFRSALSKLVKIQRDAAAEVRGAARAGGGAAGRGRACGRGPRWRPSTCLPARPLSRPRPSTDPAFPFSALPTPQTASCRRPTR
jgi:hypothetical protein